MGLMLIGQWIYGFNVDWTVGISGQVDNANEWMMGTNWSGHNVSTCQ